MFDSTHFYPVSTVTVTCEATEWTVGGIVSTSATYSAVVKNRGLAFENQDPAFVPDSVPNVKNRILNMNYLCTYNNSGPWSVATYLGALLDANVSYVNSHGEPPDHWDGTWAPAPPYPHPASWEYVYAGGASAPWNDHNTYAFTQETNVCSVGPYPPFNISGHVPLNFLEVDACECGKGADWILALWPWFDGYGHLHENQCVWATPKFSKTDICNDIATFMWSRFEIGWTAGSVQYEIENTSNMTGFEIADSATSAWRLILPGDYIIFGDPNTRLKGVYTNNMANPYPSWYHNVIF